MRFEERRVKGILARNTLLFFAAFTVLFALFGVLVFQLVSSNLYRSADEQLTEVHALAASATVDWMADDVVASEALSEKNLSVDEGEQGVDEQGANEQDAGFEVLVVDDAIIAAENDAVTLSQSYVASNPQLIYLWRNAAGEALSTEGLYASYPAYFNDIPFDSGALAQVYEVSAGGHAYRGITYAVEGGADEAYLQVLVNVDSELELLEHFTRILVVYLAVAVLVAAAVSYFLSRRTIKPIVASMNTQTEFVQNASHELRTPLAVIRATQERLLSEPNARIVDRFEEVSAAVDETKRLARLVDDLMTLTTVDASTDIEHEANPLDVSATVTDVGELYAEVAEIGGKTLRVEVLPTGEVRIEADALRQVLGILLGNALKYTEPGDIIVLRCEEQGSGHVVMSVADTGCGIDLADRERVFERFYRADAARTTPGSGLGLSIARALVERARGSIAIESNDPQGTRVVVTLPKVRTR